MSKPPRYRTIRGALWITYLTLALGFVALIVTAVVRGVMAEGRLAVQDEPLAPSNPADCAANLAEIYQSIHRELDVQRASLSRDDAAAAAGWAPLRARLDALGARCRLTVGHPSGSLAHAYQRVVTLQRLAESAAVQYRHEVGPADIEAQKGLSEVGAKSN